MKTEVLDIPVRCKNLYKDTVLSIYPSSNNADLFEDVDAKDYGESVYQLVEGCTYEYAFADEECKHPISRLDSRLISIYFCDKLKISQL